MPQKKAKKASSLPITGLQPALNTSDMASIDELIDVSNTEDSKLLSLTLDQLRTLAIAFDRGSPLEAAKVIRRQQASVQSQLDTLNKYFTEMCGDKLCGPTRRGEAWAFSNTGAFAADLAKKTLSEVLYAVRRQRQRVCKDIAVAVTTFTQPIVWRTWNLVRERLPKIKHPITHHIRTREVAQKLSSNEFDLILAPQIIEAGKMPSFDDWIFTPGITERLTALTYADNEALVRQAEPGTANVDRLFTEEPLIVPREGLVLDLLDRAVPQWRRRSKTSVQIDDARYGINLLRSGITRGTMFVFSTVGEAAVKGQLIAQYDAIPVELEVRLQQLALDGVFDRFRIVTGLFVRKSRLSECNADHPLKLFCSSFEKLFQEERVD